MLTKDIRKMDTADINEKIVELKKDLFDLRFKHATGQLENTASLKKVKRDIARMKTVLNERA